jgi:hypothetical protein
MRPLLLDAQPGFGSEGCTANLKTLVGWEDLNSRPLAGSRLGPLTVGKYSSPMRRIILRMVGLYVLAGIVTTAAEVTGALGRTCGCVPDCWCKRPGLNLFRWVTPKKQHHRQSAADKWKLSEDLS